MIAYVRPPEGLSRAMTRVADALERHAPDGVTFAPTAAEADFVLVHAIGYPETAEAVRRAQLHGVPYGILQYCLRSTTKPATVDWLSLWFGARVIWSYYDLARLVTEDLGGASMPSLRYYHAPLGVEPIFTLDVDYGHPRPWTVVTSGYVAASESVGEVASAVQIVGGAHLHLGPPLPEAPKAVDALGIGDKTLRGIYCTARFVSGLRRQEGFELPAAEGLCCGARPILYDQPAYRQWYPEGIFIPEGDPASVTEMLTGIFQSAAVPPVSGDERAAARRRFDWRPIVTGFWERVLA